MSENPKVSRLSAGLHEVDTSLPDEVAALDGLTAKERVIAQYSQKRDMSKVTIIPARPAPSLFDVNRRQRVVVYCRVSTDGLSQTSSFELQKNHYLKYVRQKPEWKLVGLYSDEGITATSTKKRIGLLTMLEDAKLGKFDIIVVKNLSRLSRNLMDCMEIIYMLRKLPHPVGILFETENMFTLDKNIDFTLQVLSLVAQEESHKKSEAMDASYQQRNANGQYSVPDLLGYDSVGVNKIAINSEEAKTVQLIFMMYLAGIDRKTIAEILMVLGRKTHTHKYRDGRVKEGVVKWTAKSVLNVLQNERRCGDVLAQKTYTPNYLDHKSVKNNGELPQYYARDQHPAIVSPDDFHLTQRLIAANRGGWTQGVPILQLYQGGLLHGFVSTVPNWLGFGAEDYNRAALRAYGIAECELDELVKRTSESLQVEGENRQDQMHTFQHQYIIDSDDYESFPDFTEQSEEPQPKTEKETYKKWVDRVRQEHQLSSDVEIIQSCDLSECEVARAQLFSLNEKSIVTLSFKGMKFNKNCFHKLGHDVEFIELSYNPIEQILIVFAARKESEKTLKWVKFKDEDYIMCTCKAAGLMEAIFHNMNWNHGYKYRLVGNVVESDSVKSLAFCLDDPIIIVPAKEGILKNLDTDSSAVPDRKKTKKMLRDGFFPEKSYIPNLEEFDTGEGPIAQQVKNIVRSRAIYYDEMVDHVNGELHIEDLGNQRYTPECIQRMRQKGIVPAEGWNYLKGMAVITERGFQIYPEHWADSFGSDPYHTFSYHLKMRKIPKLLDSKVIPYGWTVGLDLPSMDTVRKTIEILRSENSK